MGKGIEIESMCVGVCESVKVCVCSLKQREMESEKKAKERESSVPVSKDLLMRK